MTQVHTNQDRTVGHVEEKAKSDLEELLDREGYGPTASTPVIESLTRAEIDIQIATAKKYPRSLTAFNEAARNMACLNESVAASCLYAVPRDGKTIRGPSVRMAEIVASAWGNLRVDARIVEVGEASITARAVCLDLERNNAQTIEIRRRIKTKEGRRYSEDMIGTTANAAIAIARRNAVFAVVPRVYVEPILEECCRITAGDAKTLADRRTKMMEHFARMGLHPDRVFMASGVRGVEDITLDILADLRFKAESIKSGEITIEQAFPEVTNRAEGKADPLAGLKAKQAAQGGAGAGTAPSKLAESPAAQEKTTSTGSTGEPTNADLKETLPAVKAGDSEKRRPWDT